MKVQLFDQAIEVKPFLWQRHSVNPDPPTLLYTIIESIKSVPPRGPNQFVKHHHRQNALKKNINGLSLVLL